MCGVSMILMFFFTYDSNYTYYKTIWNEMLTLSLLQMPCVGTVLYYTEGNSCNQKVFWHSCNRARGFSYRLKRKGNGYTKSPNFPRTRDFVSFSMNTDSLNPWLTILKIKVEFILCWPNPIFLPFFFSQNKWEFYPIYNLLSYIIFFFFFFFYSHIFFTIMCLYFFPFFQRNIHN